jgi:hypothetical protein
MDTFTEYLVQRTSKRVDLPLPLFYLSIVPKDCQPIKKNGDEPKTRAQRFEVTNFKHLGGVVKHRQ